MLYVVKIFIGGILILGLYCGIKILEICQEKYFGKEKG